MTTTTIRLPIDMKTRIANVAATANTNAHSFILQAITDKLVTAELQADFQASALQRFDKILTTEKAIAWADMRHYLEKRANGDPVNRPNARKLGV